MLTAEIWPALDYSRVPYRLYHDPEAYEREQEQDFPRADLAPSRARGRDPEPWRFSRDLCRRRRRSSSTATEHGAIHAFVNRCAHRGAMVRRELSGNASDHTCIYHQWCYGLDGGLMAMPFRRGISGKGGLDADFDMEAHGLRRLQVDAIDGVLFGTLVDDAEPLEDYLGAPVLGTIAPACSTGRCSVLGYQPSADSRQLEVLSPRTPATTITPACCMNFCCTFGLDRSTQVGGVTMDARHRHNITWAEAGKRYRRNREPGLRRCPGTQRLSVAARNRNWSRFRRERNDPLNIAITSVFPGGVFVQISNSLRRAPDPPARRRRSGSIPDHARLRGRHAGDGAAPAAPGELVGPAGLVSMEDGEAIEIAHRASKPDGDCASVIELGGGGRRSPTATTASPTCRCAASGPTTPSCWGSSPSARCDDARSDSATASLLHDLLLAIRCA